MKTAISIPEDVFEAAEAVARRAGLSRSQLYVEAVKLFLLKHGDEGITDRLNEVYGTNESGVDLTLLRMQIATIGREKW